jgi:excisionase family DNA binding protein
MAAVPVAEMEEVPFYTIESLAHRLSVSELTVKRMLRDGEIPSYKFRGIRRIDKVDVDSYLAKHRDEGRKAA